MKTLLLALIAAMCLSMVRADFYQVTLNGNGDITTDKQTELVAKVGNSVMNTFSKCTQKYQLIPPLTVVDVPATRRQLRTKRELWLSSCPSSCRLHSNYQWCVILGCICNTCGRRLVETRGLQSDAAGVQKCADKINKIVSKLGGNYKVVLEVTIDQVLPNGTRRTL
jgi:hypothetical protein